MRVTIPFQWYNERRFSKPWVAAIAFWPVGGMPELRYGNCVGEGEDEGYLEINAEPGEVLRWGRKDRRGRDGSISRWGVVTDDGSVTEVTWTAARAAWLKGRGNPAKGDLSLITDSELILEMTARGLLLGCDPPGDLRIR